METQSNKYKKLGEPLPAVEMQSPFDMSSYLSLTSSLDPLFTERGEEFANHVGLCGYIPIEDQVK